jgi:hypothetical protein
LRGKKTAAQFGGTLCMWGATCPQRRAALRHSPETANLWLFCGNISLFDRKSRTQSTGVIFVEGPGVRLRKSSPN